MNTKIQPKNWHVVKLGDVANVLPGFAFKSSDFKKDGDIPVVKIKNITDDLNVSIENGEYLDKSALNEKTKKYLIGNGDILVAMTGATAGKVGKFRSNKKALLNQRVAKISPKNIDTDFLWTLLGNKDTINLLYRLADGAAQPNMSGGQIENLEFRIPTQIEDQKQIADVLSAYDDLIENNMKRIKILEEIAQVIYKEWFVENSKFKNQNAKLSEIVKPQYGYTESASNKPIGPKYLRGTDINKNSYIDWSAVPYCKISDEDKGKYQLKKNDIVIIRMADPGKIGIVEQDIDAVFASYLIRLEIVDKRISPYYLFYFLNSDQYQNYIRGASGGTTRKSASAGVVTGTNIIIPPKELVKKFEEKISLLRAKLNNLLVQNSKLRQARDLLLPKLVAGEIRI
ncbi:restriction endonuclease subunit S [Patescibacteria group bacterium]|nr:restriction endonuclease subunit S [Patescibacteria group bacterium]